MRARRARAAEAPAAQAAAGRRAVQLNRRAARGPVRRHLALLHLAQLGRDAALKLHRQRRERVVGARLAGIGHHRTRQLCARGTVQVVEEPLAPQAEHLRRAVVVPGAAHPVERCHEDAAPGGEHHVVRARRAPAALRLEQRADPRRARRGGERRALVPRPLGARRRVGAHLHELRRRVLAQALARARGAARVARGVVEGEPRLGGVAPTDARVQRGARRATVGARAPRAERLDASGRRHQGHPARALRLGHVCGPLGLFFLFTHVRTRVWEECARVPCLGGWGGLWPSVQARQQKNPAPVVNTHTASLPRLLTHTRTLHPCTSKWYSAPDCAPATSLGQCTATLCSGPGA